MGGIEIEPWEPEETVGKLWHAFASRLDAPAAHDAAAVRLEELSGRLAVFFRGLGGDPSVEIRAAAERASGHRLSLKRRLAVPEERVVHAAFDGEALRLPPRIAAFPAREANGALYLWLAAAAAHAPAPVAEADPLRADLRALAAAQTMTRAALAAAPGLAALHAELAAATLATRPRRALPAWEAAVESVVLCLLGRAASERLGAEPDPAGEDLSRDARAGNILARISAPEPDLGDIHAPRRYRPFLPVPLWPELRPTTREARPESEAETPDGPPQESPDDAKQARRRQADQADRRDSLILHKFETILSFAQFLNLNRRIDEDDPDNAQKAARDADEIALTQVSKAPATRLKLHLDLAPEEADRERLSSHFTYHEWDARAGAYLPDHVRVLESPADTGEPPAPDARTLRRIRAVRRQFEALRPARVVLPAQPDGEELDLDAAVRARADLVAAGRGSDRLWRSARRQARDLSVSILLDASRSTESAVGARSVIEIEREALTALAWGLKAAGDSFAVNAFSSLRRDRVYIRRVKGFDEPMSAAVEARLAGLRPGFYTRLGAAIRHVSARLARRASTRRLILVVTDGKPNDLDHYEGRHGVEDTAMAVREARRAGHAVFGVTIDAKAKAVFARLFGRGGFAAISDPDRLTRALPEIYRHLVGA